MANRWKKVETVTNFIFLGFKITSDSDCNNEIPRHLLLGRKAMTNLAAAAESLQSCLTLCDPIDSSPPGSPVPGILQARTLEWVAISFSNAWKWEVKVKSLSRVRLFVTPWTAAYQAPPSMGFSRQEYWSGVPLTSLMTNLDRVLKNKDITLPTKVHIVKAMAFPVVMYGCESWTTKKVECWRIDAFELWCWKTLEGPLQWEEIKPVYPKGNQPWILIERTDAKAGPPILWPLVEDSTHWKRPWFWKRLRTWWKGRKGEWDGWMASPTQWTWVWTTSRRQCRTGNPGMLRFMGSQRVRHNLWTEQKQRRLQGFPVAQR